MHIPVARSYALFAVAALIVACEASRVASHGTGRLEPCPTHAFKVRKEWGELNRQDRKHYIDAVLCMQKLPSQLDHALYNSTTRYEDFVVVHMNLTRYIHHNALFLPWHRGFISLFERALAKECGYKGTLPYWDWVKNAKNISASPLFDGSPYSFSGQGIPVPPEDKIPSCNAGSLVCPPGTGGGCVTDGPFKNYVWGYLPASQNPTNTPEPGLPADIFAYEPRCFTRDLNQYIADHYQTAAQMRSLLAKKTIAEFQDALDSEGLHLAGHEVTGGANGNIYVSVQEPTFFLHHAMVDRVWAQWQALDPWDRTYGENGFAGTVTSFNNPPSANATADTILAWGPLGPERTLVEFLAVGHCGLCYKYT
ncbi:tyrosinase central domain protein [Auricularia subglabra TFB-10046 SS5]|nr:tyrosinase central domain protein [Auricularia subglabra TFB-10046 SS5]